MLRPKCSGNVRIVSKLPTVYPQINEKYLCHNDDVAWAKQAIRGTDCASRSFCVYLASNKKDENLATAFIL